MTIGPGLISLRQEVSQFMASLDYIVKSLNLEKKGEKEERIHFINLESIRDEEQTHRGINDFKELEVQLALSPLLFLLLL